MTIHPRRKWDNQVSGKFNHKEVDYYSGVDNSGQSKAYWVIRWSSFHNPKRKHYETEEWQV